MNLAIDVLLHAGRSAVDVALYTLLPIMVLMMIVMRAPEASGALDKIVALLTPVVRPFGLTGLGVLAMIQVSFVASITTLALMEDRVLSDRRLAAALRHFSRWSSERAISAGNLRTPPGNHTRVVSDRGACRRDRNLLDSGTAAIQRSKPDR
jgi:hypothetical protein